MNKRKFMLQSKALESGDPELIKKASREYDKLYHADYLKLYRKRHCRAELYFEKGDYKEIEDLAKDHEMKVPEFIKAVLMEYQGKLKLVRYPTSISNLIVEIKKVGNLINQTLRYAHSRNSFTKTEFELLRKQLNGLEKKVVQELSEPKQLIEILKEAIMESRLTIEELKEVINQTHNNL